MRDTFSVRTGSRICCQTERSQIFCQEKVRSGDRGASCLNGAGKEGVEIMQRWCFVRSESRKRPGFIKCWTEGHKRDEG